MKQRLFSLMLVIVANMGLVSAQNTSGKCGDNLIWKISLTDYSLTISGTGNMTSYSVGNSSPWPNNITSVIIENGVSSIGDYAFYGCSKITSITIPNSITNIGNYAFSHCSSLTSITIPNSVTSIGRSAFSGCSSLTSVTIPNSVTSIGKLAFYSCGSLTSVTIPNSVTTIGESAFYNCSSLTSVTINSNDIVSKNYSPTSNLIDIFGSQVIEYTIADGVTSIGDCAFYNFSGISELTYVTISSSVTSIGESAFYNCSGLKEVHISDLAKWCTLSFSSYSANPLSYAHNLYVNGLLVTDLVIPEGVTSIGGYAFSGCSSLTSVTIGNSVTSIGNSAFYGCSGLTSVTIPNGVTSIGQSTFYGCSGLTSVTIPSSVTSIGGRAFSGCSGLTSITIPNSVTSIGEGAFGFCSSLTSVTIGNSVTSIGEGAFGFCSSLTSVTIPNSVTSIGNSAFYGCSGLTSVTIPNGVTSIGQSTFYGCSGLTSVTIPSSVTSIGGRAFYGCSGLTSVTIPSSVTSIGDEAFSNCNINKIDFNGTIEEWCNKSWNPQNISTSYSLYFNGSIVNKVAIPENYTNIGQNAFFGCSNLTSVAFASSVKVIESGAFQGCNAIDTITCYSMRPPTVEENAFEKLPLSTIVYVPADYMTYYQVHEFWGLYDVRPISTTEVETEEVTITPTDNTVDIVWPTITGATTYELIIRDTDGNIVCTLIFDAQGHLTQIAFNVPARGNAPEQTQTAGFSFTITGLNSGTTYDYTLTAKDAAGNVLDTQTGTFTTDGLTGIEDIPSSIDLSAPRKVLIDGQLYIILPDNTRYNLQGTEVK